MDTLHQETGHISMHILSLAC